MSASPPDNGRFDFFDYTDGALTTSISQAILRNNKDTLLRLLKKRKRNPLPVPADNRNWTVLHVAASRPQYKDCLELLLKYKDSILVDLDSLTFQGETALHLACENGCEESVEILLQNGCDPDVETLEEETSLHIAVNMGNLKIVESLLNYTKKIQHSNSQQFTPLHLSALQGYLEISRVLLDKGADVRSIDYNINLPLHLALQNNYFDIVRLLLKSDLTTINCENVFGITPLMLAVENCNLENIRFLLENGAKTDACDKKGRMPLHFAAYRGDVEILQLLLQSTEPSSVEQCASNIVNVLKANRVLYSLTCCAIHSKNAECLEILLSSKLPKSILEMPYVKFADLAFSPLVYLLKVAIGESPDELLQVLLKHKIIMLDEFSGAFQMEWPYRMIFNHPFTYIFNRNQSLLEEQHFFNLLITNDVTADYCLQCYCDNSQPFATFAGYERFYEPLITAIHLKKVEYVKFIMSNSVVLEPDTVNFQVNLIPVRYPGLRSIKLTCPEEMRSICQYLISLKPIYFLKLMFDSSRESDLPPDPHLEIREMSYPRSEIQEVFAKSTLKQFCRTVIRYHLREYTLEDNLRNFKRKIMELPLPMTLKDYLLFRD